MKKDSNYKIYASHEAKIGEVKKCVLLYSGGLDTSVMLKWIQDVYKCEVVALTIDLGQQADDLEEIKKKAIFLGAISAYVLDCKDEFAEKYISKWIKANASYQWNYHLSTPIGRPLLAKKAVEIAHKEWADCIAHGCTGKWNDQVRLEASVLCYDPSMKIIAPVRQWWMWRQEELDYAIKHEIPVKQTKNVSYSRDDNMWWITGEWWEIENPELEPKLEKILQVTTLPEQASDQKEYLTLSFEQWIPAALNGEKMKLAQLIQKLNVIGGKHGVGYTILTEDRFVGLKVRWVYENPWAEIIITAHKNLEKLVSTQEENAFKEIIDSKRAYLCYGAKWLEPTFDHINSYIDDQNKKVTGEVTMTLYKGKVEVVKQSSPYSLFDHNLATFEKNAKFNQNSSAWFIEISSLAMKTHAQVHKNLDFNNWKDEITK